jgi:hypothetical protein
MKRIHVIPFGGEEPMHTCHASCFCKPIENQDKVMVHHAKDLREARERHGRNSPDEQWLLVEEVLSNVRDEALRTPDNET